MEIRVQKEHFFKAKIVIDERKKVCKDQKLKESEPKSSPKNQKSL